MEIETFKTITEAGGVGIAIVTITILYKIVTNHEQHFLDSITKNTEALTKLCDCIEALKDRLIKND